MTISLNGRMDEQAQLLQATSLVALASTAGKGTYVSLKNFRRATIIIDVVNAGSGVTGAAITLKQATTVAAAGEKALAFTRMKANIDVAAAPLTFTETAVASNTFTTDATVSKQLRYVIEVDAEQLDAANSFDCLSVQGASGAGMTGLISYILWGARYSGGSALTD
jgi:hypothetical protein